MIQDIQRTYGRKVIVVVGTLFVCILILLTLYIKSQKQAENLDLELVSSKNIAYQLNENITSQLQALERQNAEIIGLQNELTSTKEKMGEQREENQKLEEKIRQSEEKLTNLQSDVEERMAWLKANAQLMNLGYPSYDERNYEGMLRRLKNRCTRTTGDTCYINAGCLPLKNEKSFGLVYKTDEETSGASDKLQDISSIFRNNGGDCEDYALLFKAEFNSMRELCTSSRVDEIVVEAYKQSSSGTFYLEYDDENPWFISSAKPVFIEPRFNTPFIVCGTFYQGASSSIQSEEEYSGHCVIGLSESEVVGTNDLGKVKGVPLIEPQTGEYLGALTESDGFILLDSQTYKKYMQGSVKYDKMSGIWMIVSDSDILSFSGSKNEWLSYADIRDEIEDSKGS